MPTETIAMAIGSDIATAVPNVNSRMITAIVEPDQLARLGRRLRELLAQIAAGRDLEPCVARRLGGVDDRVRLVLAQARRARRSGSARCSRSSCPSRARRSPCPSSGLTALMTSSGVLPSDLTSP